MHGCLIVFISRVIRWNCFSKMQRISLPRILQNNDLPCLLKTAGWSQTTAFLSALYCTMHCVQCTLENIVFDSATTLHAYLLTYISRIVHTVRMFFLWFCSDQFPIFLAVTALSLWPFASVCVTECAECVYKNHIKQQSTKHREIAAKENGLFISHALGEASQLFPVAITRQATYHVGYYNANRNSYQIFNAILPDCRVI